MASIVVAGDTSGTVTLAAPAVSGTTTLTLPTTSGTIVTTSGAQTIEFADGSASTPSITNSGDTNTGMFFPAADTIAFAEGGTEAMRLDANGNVGIGVTPNSGWASTVKAIQFGNPLVNSVTSSIATIAGNVNLTNDAYYDGTNWKYLDSYFATRYFSGDGIHTWSTAASGTAGNTITWSERMRIDSNGNLWFNTSTFSSSMQSGLSLQTASNSQLWVSHANGTGSGQYYAVFFYNGSNIGGVTQNGTTAVAYNTSSDYRLKDNIAPMTGALDKVALLKPVTYKWKIDGSDGQGFIAHELAEVVPDCVSGEKDAVNEDGSIKPQGVDTSFLVATLTAAIQEQQTIINDLKARIETLEAK